MARLRVEALEDRGLRFVEVRQPIFRKTITTTGVLQELLVDVAIATLLPERHTDLWTTRTHLSRHNDNGHGSPPPILVSDRRGRDGDTLARDVLENVDLIRERAARKHFKYVERGLERPVRPLGHQSLHRGHREPRHRASRRVPARVADHPGDCNGSTPRDGRRAGRSPTERRAPMAADRMLGRTNTPATVPSAPRRRPPPGTPRARSARGSPPARTVAGEMPPTRRRCRRSRPDGSASARGPRARRSARPARGAGARPRRRAEGRRRAASRPGAGA